MPSVALLGATREATHGRQVCGSQNFKRKADGFNIIAKEIKIRNCLLL